MEAFLYGVATAPPLISLEAMEAAGSIFAVMVGAYLALLAATQIGTWIYGSMGYPGSGSIDASSLPRWYGRRLRNHSAVAGLLGVVSGLPFIYANEDALWFVGSGWSLFPADAPELLPINAFLFLVPFMVIVGIQLRAHVGIAGLLLLIAPTSAFLMLAFAFGVAGGPIALFVIVALIASTKSPGDTLFDKVVNSLLLPFKFGFTDIAELPGRVREWRRGEPLPMDRW